MIDTAHAAGFRVYGATLMPFGDSFYDSEAHESARQAVNEWIRNSGRFDAVIDLDAALRDPGNPRRLSPAGDTGDHLRPNETGHKMMAEAVDLRLFSKKTDVNRCQRLSINRDWRFFKYDSAADADGLIYDIRPEIKDRKDNRSADSKPTATHPITFEIEGPGEIVATANGDPTNLVSFLSQTRETFSGLALLIIRSKQWETGSITVTAKSKDLSDTRVDSEIFSL